VWEGVSNPDLHRPATAGACYGSQLRELQVISERFALRLRRGVASGAVTDRRRSAWWQPRLAPAADGLPVAAAPEPGPRRRFRVLAPATQDPTDEANQRATMRSPEGERG
jgi:hypothetical protein